MSSHRTHRKNVLTLLRALATIDHPAVIIVDHQESVR